jgi:hypothetical protein
MKKIINFKLFKESNSTDDDESVVNYIINTMQDMIDDGYDPVFISQDNATTSQNIFAGKISEFKPVYRAGNKKRSSFRILFKNIDSYAKFAKIVDEMISPIGRLIDGGWILSDLVSNNMDDDVSPLISIYYKFTKPDVKLDFHKSESSLTDDLIKVFMDTPLNVERDNIDIDGNMINVGFDTNTYDGRLPDDKLMYDIFENICDILGFVEYEYRHGDWGVTFYIEYGD